MRRVAFLAISLLLLIMLNTLIIKYTPEQAGGLPPACQARLDEYLHASFGPGTATVQAVARAKKPWHFHEGATHGTFGDSVHFQTEHYSSILGPLPFPPDEVWCVLLRREDTTMGRSSEEASHAVVFLGLHIDMYNADWVVHSGEGDPFSAPASQMLSGIGCDLGMN